MDKLLSFLIIFCRDFILVDIVLVEVPFGLVCTRFIALFYAVLCDAMGHAGF